MLTYTTYSEAGGVGKSTLAANLADAHAQSIQVPDRLLSFNYP